VAIVTGASSGIGRATAEALGARGYRVAAAYRTNRSDAEALAAAFRGRAYGVDVADPAGVAALVSQVESDLGPIVVAISNAGFYEEVPVEEVTDAQWQRMLRVHLGGAFHLARAVVPGMLRRGRGSIVLVASELALVGSDRVVPYVAAKAALLGFGRSLARELAPAIRVNVVAPGPVDTALLPDRDREPAYVSTIPLGRIGRPEEIASAIVHIAEAPWTTGAVYSVNGGVVIQ
jgi:NAD(P)-dependent dehydrogenase (short-subunit alcohol dehydrogenase family)